MLRAIATIALAISMGMAAHEAGADVVMSSSNAPDRQRATGAFQEGAEGQAVAAVRPEPRQVSVSYDSAWLAAQPQASGDAEWRCLSEALYFEARGEGVRGLFAVAEVILNRRDSTAFPDTVCGVVRQGTGERYRCQFTYYCDGRAEVMHNRRAIRMVGKVARAMLDGAPRALTGGATYYHTRAVSPSWSRVFARTSTIGMHHFYRASG